MFSFLLLILGVFLVVVSFPVVLGVTLGYLMLFLFLEVGEYCYNFLFRTAFVASHRVSVVFSLPFVSIIFFLSLLISSGIFWLFRNMLFNLHVFVLLTDFFLVVDIYSHRVGLEKLLN